MKETSKCFERRVKDKTFDLYLHGLGIDIGSGYDLLKVPGGEVQPFDFRHGDAQFLFGVKDSIFDFVYSSHCLEDLVNPNTALSNWIRVCKSGGYIYVVVPDEELYEKNTWPSRFNIMHRWSCTFTKGSKLPKSIFLPEFLEDFGQQACLIKMFLNSDNYNPFLPDEIDQTRGKACCQIEFILQKK